MKAYPLGSRARRLCFLSQSCVPMSMIGLSQAGIPPKATRFSEYRNTQGFGEDSGASPVPSLICQKLVLVRLQWFKEIPKPMTPSVRPLSSTSPPWLWKSHHHLPHIPGTAPAPTTPHGVFTGKIRAVEWFKDETSNQISKTDGKLI